MCAPEAIAWTSVQSRLLPPMPASNTTAGAALAAAVDMQPAVADL